VKQFDIVVLHGFRIGGRAAHKHVEILLLQCQHPVHDAGRARLKHQEQNAGLAAPMMSNTAFISPGCGGSCGGLLLRLVFGENQMLSLLVSTCAAKTPVIGGPVVRALGGPVGFDALPVVEIDRGHVRRLDDQAVVRLPA